MAKANASLPSDCPKIDDNLILDVKKDDENEEGDASNNEEDDAGMIVMNVALGDFDGSAIANAEEKEVDEEKGDVKDKEIKWIKPKGEEDDEEKGEEKGKDEVLIKEVATKKKRGIAEVAK